MIDCATQRRGLISRSARYLADVKVFILALRATRTFAVDLLLPSDWIFRSTSDPDKKAPIVSIWQKDWHR
jgi:hypothetical protein